MKPQIILPPRNPGEQTETLQLESNLVIVGANGSGKTRFGSWVEQAQQDVFVHRISAQRALGIPEFADLKNLEQAEKGLYFGADGANINAQHKTGQRWGYNPEISMLSDYHFLLSTLFARNAARDSKHVKDTRDAGVYIPIPQSPIDIIEAVWADIMPHRKISFHDGRVMTSKDQNTYHGKNMSDGERVTLYLLGEALCSPENSIIVVDEPELHLHKSIMVRLWNKVEELCPNKLIVYITHDLDFASSRIGTKKIWVKQYDSAGWMWQDVPEIEGMPESLTVEVIGSRKNIIFTEGERDSYDTALYQAIYPSFHIMPRGGCEKVIEATKALQGVQAIHHISASGIIDNDYRTAEEIAALMVSGVYTIDVAEIENLFCVDALLEIVAVNQALNPAEVIPQVHTFVLAALQDEFNVQVSARVEKEVLFKLKKYVKIANNEKGVTDGLTNVVDTIDVAALYAESSALYQGIIDRQDYDAALRYYNRKSLAKRISVFFNLRNDEYTSLILRLLKTQRKTQIVAGLMPFVPIVA